MIQHHHHLLLIGIAAVAFGAVSCRPSFAQQAEEVDPPEKKESSSSFGDLFNKVKDLKVPDSLSKCAALCQISLM